MTTREASGIEAFLSKRADWASPQLLAGRSRYRRVAGGLLVLTGALTDTIAFKNTLGLALLQVPETQIWLMAAGVTGMALIAAGLLGISLATRGRAAHSDSKLATVSTAAAWVGLGFAMFLVRWLDVGGGTTGGTLSGSTASAHTAPLVALFFAAIYFISGAGTMFGAERLYNPEYTAFRRLARQYRKQAQRVAEAEATVERARAAVDHQNDELDREDHRRQAAIAERHALGAEAANYARLLMAAMLRDPAKTGLTETGPAPQVTVAASGANGITRPKAEPVPDAGRSEDWQSVVHPTRAESSSRI